MSFYHVAVLEVFIPVVDEYGKVYTDLTEYIKSRDNYEVDYTSLPLATIMNLIPESLHKYVRLDTRNFIKTACLNFTICISSLEFDKLNADDQAWFSAKADCPQRIEKFVRDGNFVWDFIDKKE